VWGTIHSIVFFNTTEQRTITIAALRSDSTVLTPWVQ